MALLNRNFRLTSAVRKQAEGREGSQDLTLSEDRFLRSRPQLIMPLRLLSALSGSATSDVKASSRKQSSHGCRAVFDV